MKLTPILLSICFLAACGSTPRPKSSFDLLLEQEGLTTGTRIRENSTSSGNSVTRERCVSGDEVPKELRERCWEQTCERVGNGHNCVDGGDLRVKKFIEEYEAKADQEQKEIELRVRTAKEKCLAGDLSSCEGWLQQLGSADENGLGLICADKKTFTCKSKFQTLKVEEFIPECRFQADRLSCEEGNKGEFIQTEVFLRKKKR